MPLQHSMACDIVVFGGTGDLALRKLLPALYYLHRDRHLHPQTRILALARGTNQRPTLNWYSGMSASM